MATDFHAPPRAKDIAVLKEDPALADRLVETFPELRNLYELRDSLSEELVRMYDHEKFWYYQDSDMPLGHVRIMAWKILCEYHKAVTQKILIPLVEKDY